MGRRVILVGGILACIAGCGFAQRPWPATGRGIHVFNDQLSQGLTDSQIAFCATNYAGTQKMRRSEADRLRAVNPLFLILHYRLGLGLGYRAPVEGCAPTGDWLAIVEGDDWVQEWPGNTVVQENWFFHWPANGGARVFQCQWGWHLMNVNNPDWRSWWAGEVNRQLAANDDDGLFMDSFSVPNFLGGNTYNPNLPAYDPVFEQAWMASLPDFLRWLKGRLTQRAYLVPNVGAWITSRDDTDYSAADGLMIEGFALEGEASPYAYDDWRLQMDRILAAVNRAQAILAQTYVNSASALQERMFTTGCYLLVRGDRTYLNLDLDLEPEWFPEYDIPIGEATAPPAQTIDTLDPDGDQVFRRDFDNGMVLVNPTNPWDGSGVTRTVELGAPFRRAGCAGGGFLPPDGIPEGTLSYETVTEVTLPPYSAAVLLFDSNQRDVGDLNLDGRVNAQDILILQLYLAGAIPQGSPPFLAPLTAADINRDLVRNAVDLASLGAQLADRR